MSYDRKDITPGIVHFGVGGFHRAHLEFYTHSLLEAFPDQRQWGISGAMILPFDESLYARLKSQDGIYTLSAFAPDGSHTFTEIHSLVELNWGVQDRESIISRLASPEIKIITLTITEGGYTLDGADENSVFGYVCEALEKRMDAGLPITILSCDNLQHNGDTARRTFMGYFKAHNPKVAEWAERNVTFPNSMVDRITPASKPADIERLNALNGTDDKAPVFCEDFIQWVVEDNFIAGRPAWEKVGVQFTNDVSAYENMKLSLLNASHTLLSYPAALEGIKKVDEVLRIEKYRMLIRDFMDKDITCYVPAPEGIELDEYKNKLLSRFGNPAISDQVSRLCSDGMAKFAVYVVPNLKKALADGHDMERFAFLIASYWRYLSTARTLEGEAIEIVEPHLTEKDRELIKNGTAREFLTASAFTDCKFNNEFYNLYDEYVKDCEFYHIGA